MNRNFMGRLLVIAKAALAAIAVRRLMFGVLLLPYLLRVEQEEGMAIALWEVMEDEAEPRSQLLLHRFDDEMTAGTC